MLQRIKENFHTVLQLLGVNFGMRRINTVAELEGFISKRSALVAQTTLYGYLKTRMGTRYREYFEDEKFAASMRSSAVKLAVACLEDFAVFCTAEIGQGRKLTRSQSQALAEHCFMHGLHDILSEQDWQDVPDQAAKEFRARVALIDWSAVGRDGDAFAKSQQSLVRYAPVIDEYKASDGEIMTNSIRFRWLETCERFRARLDAELVAKDWLDGGWREKVSKPEVNSH